MDSRGISLRFPRFLKVREDKNADEATSAEQVSFTRGYQRICLTSDTRSANFISDKLPLVGGRKPAEEVTISGDALYDPVSM